MVSRFESGSRHCESPDDVVVFLFRSKRYEPLPRYSIGHSLPNVKAGSSRSVFIGLLETKTKDFRVVSARFDAVRVRRATEGRSRTDAARLLPVTSSFTRGHHGLVATTDDVTWSGFGLSEDGYGAPALAGRWVARFGCVTRRGSARALRIHITQGRV